MRSREVGIFKRVKGSDLLAKDREKVDKLGNQGKLFPGSTVRVGMIVEFVWEQLLLHTYHATDTQSCIGVK